MLWRMACKPKAPMVMRPSRGRTIRRASDANVAAVLVGIPMYSNAAGIVPVVEALLGKGAALGTVLAFMMAVSAISFPEMIILRRVLKIQLIGVFAGILAVAIIFTGYLFNAIM